jgi:hypothetical protein
MSGPMRDADDETNRIVELFGRFAADLARTYSVPPERIGKAAVAVAVTLYMEHHINDVHSAAAYLRQFADELCEGEPPPPAALN